MSTATFTVPLTARVLRAILADIEGGTGCGCRTTEPMTSEDYVEAAEILTSGTTAAPVVLDAKPLAMRDLSDNITAPLISGIVEQGNPFVATPLVPPVPPLPDLMPAISYADTVFVEQPTPMPPVPVTTPPTITVPLDSEGLPWDKRIHASTRTRRVGDDTWKLMKGVDKTLVERVKAELRATMAANGPLTPPVPSVVPHLSGSWSPETGHVVGVPTPPVTIIPAPVHPVFAEPTNYSGAQSGGYAPTVTAPVVPLVPAPPAPVATPQPPVVPVAPTPPAPGAPTTFSDFVTYATNKIVGKQFSRDQLQAACANEGITSMPMLENRPDLIPAIWKFLESISIQASSVGGE